VDFRAFLAISLGAIAGANARYLIGLWAVERFGPALPIGTFAINVSGSFLVGLFLALLTERIPADPLWRLLLTVGFCGSYTTFSTYTFEAIALARDGQIGAAIAYLTASVVVGVVATLGGVYVARLI
jgi:CrcB protein